MDPTTSEFLEDIQPFKYQVAGHNVKNVAGSSGILKHKDGYLLKSITKSLQGEVEISFYEKVKQDADFSIIRKFIPEYFGFTNLQINGLDLKYLKLKDVTEDFCKPCVMDVKIGKQTWEPNAPLEKRKGEDVKYAISKQEFEFCIPGYHVYDVSVGKLIKFGKDEGKRLNKESTYEAFKQFFNHSSGVSHIILQHIVKQLNELLNWWNSQRVIHLYASSILLVYDAEKLQISSSKSLESDDSWAKVYMIDFAHVVPANNQKDLNYASGLSKLIAALKSIM